MRPIWRGAITFGSKAPARKAPANNAPANNAPAKKKAAKKKAARRPVDQHPWSFAVYGVSMAIGLGIVLIVIGAIFLFALNVDIPFFTDNTLGLILILAGVLSLVIGLVMQFSRNRTKHVQENRYSGPPPAA